jgi:hypothetical protein
MAVRLRIASLALSLLTLAVSAAGAGRREDRPTTPLLDVPYLTQTQQLCGGAAVAMVLRYWGERDVLPQDFASLVEPAGDGIRTSVLADAVLRRGWQAVPAGGHGNAPAAWLASEIDKGRPVIALVEVGPRTYHYVVVVSVTANDIIYHDPARAPFRIVSHDEFDRQWEAANRWALVVLPAAGMAPVGSREPVAAANSAAELPASTPCRELIAQSIALARAGQLDDAERGLRAAGALCPDTAEPQLELGGVRFLQRRYAEAESLAAGALEASPEDEIAWDLLGTSRYLQGNLQGALEAWNEIGRPRTDVVRIEGVERLDHPVVVKRIGLEARAPITPSAFGRAERRLIDLPTIKRASLNYFPRADGSADVRAVLAERSVLPSGLIGWGAVGVNSAFRRELRLLVAGPFRQGETFDIRYRWRPNRPRLRLGFAMPAPGFLPGILGVEGWWERQTYQSPELPLREVRNRVGAYLTDWITDDLRWLAGGAADEFSGRRYLAFHAGLERRWFDDHLSTVVSGGYWTPTGFQENTRGFGQGHAQVSWRSSTNASAPEWLARAGYTAVGQTAPLAVWPIAGSGESRGPLLRAHELHSDGIVVSGVFGRHMAFGSLEYQQPVYARKGASVAVAGFADTGRAWQRPFSPGPSPLHVDVGVGLRLSAGGYDDQLRIDFAYGLEDGSRTISAGYIVPFGQ